LLLHDVSPVLRFFWLLRFYSIGVKLLSTAINKSSSENNQTLTTDDIKWLFNELRKASVIWSGRKEVLALSRKKVFLRRAKNGNPVYKFQWQCAICDKWFMKETDMEVDHISEIGGVTAFTGDWNEVIRKMLPRPVEKHLQVLCRVCHLKKTNLYCSARSKYKRKNEKNFED